MFSPFAVRRCSGKNGHPQYIGITS
nr:unnamed protein product [Callosobruchus analis]